MAQIEDKKTTKTDGKPLIVIDNWGGLIAVGIIILIIVLFFARGGMDGLFKAFRSQPNVAPTGCYADGAGC